MGHLLVCGRRNFWFICLILFFLGSPFLVLLICLLNSHCKLPSLILSLVVWLLRLPWLSWSLCVMS